MKMIAEFLLTTIAPPAFLVQYWQEVDLCWNKDYVSEYVDTLFLIGQYFFLSSLYSSVKARLPYFPEPHLNESKI